jgi:hypothetical protein
VQEDDDQVDASGSVPSVAESQEAAGDLECFGQSDHEEDRLRGPMSVFEDAPRSATESLFDLWNSQEQGPVEPVQRCLTADFLRDAAMQHLWC